MLDILLKQMELQDVEQHMGIHTSVCENVSRLIKCMVTAARVGLSSHVCALKVFEQPICTKAWSKMDSSPQQVAECAYCEASTMWHQLSTKLVEFMAPLNPVRPPDVGYKSHHDTIKQFMNYFLSRFLLKTLSKKRNLPVNHRPNRTRTRLGIAMYPYRWHRYQFHWVPLAALQVSCALSERLLS